MPEVIGRKSKFHSVGCLLKGIEPGTSIVNQNVNMALFCSYPGSELTHLPPVREVGLKELSPPGTRSLTQFFGKSDPNRFTSGHEDEVGSGRAQGERCGLANSGSGSCDNTGLPLQGKR